MVELVEINSIFQEIFIYIIIAILAIGLAIIKKWFTGVTAKQDKMQGCLNDVNARGIRHGKAFLEIGEHLDEETARLHPDKSPRPIKERIQRIITDDMGNL